LNQDFVRLEHLSKRFRARSGLQPAVDDVSLSIAKGESLTLLGPSGCGKTTILRMIAGLEQPDHGSIFIGNETVVSTETGVDLPPERRRIGMVFQSYAIWPHMTVGQNVGFPLRVRRVSSAEKRERVRQALALVGLSALEDQPATQLSGGQQQRVALARALVHEPSLLLLDEPLSNLDVKLREQMRVELKLLQARLNVTLIHVTHDQTEALSLSDRIVILNAGRVEQIGAPRELYENPRTPFVRDFLGKSVTLAGRIRSAANGSLAIELNGHPDALLQVPAGTGPLIAPGRDVEISVRPEAVRLGHPADSQSEYPLKAVVEAVLYQGERSECEVRIGDAIFSIYLPSSARVSPGETVDLVIAAGSVRVWPK
jgi:iron(III) transport system ATP-binding protein